MQQKNDNTPQDFSQQNSSSLQESIRLNGKYESPEGVLDSWKEIANFLRREVRTVQLWEKREGLPIHRHFHVSRASVHAFRSELVAWCHAALKSRKMHCEV
jgi:hypothetical protein